MTSALVLQAVSKMPTHNGAIRLQSGSAHDTVSLVEKPEINRNVAERIVHDVLKNDAEALPQRFLQFADYIQSVPVYECVQSST